MVGLVGGFVSGVSHEMDVWLVGGHLVVGLRVGAWSWAVAAVGLHRALALTGVNWLLNHRCPGWRRIRPEDWSNHGVAY